LYSRPSWGGKKNVNLPQVCGLEKRAGRKKKELGVVQPECQVETLENRGNYHRKINTKEQTEWEGKKMGRAVLPNSQLA